MDLNAYLARIGLDHRPPATLAGLRAVHRAHLLAIPYENIDVQLGRPVTIERSDIYDKIVVQRRGGWCYEMNGILGWALGELGFSVTRATGAVMREAGGEAQVANHLVLRVDLAEDTYLADVGFGDGPLDPIAVGEGAFASNGFTYGLSRPDGNWWRLRNHPFGAAPSFDFDLSPVSEDKLAAKCAELQTAPDSHFVQNLFCFRQREGAIHMLLGRTLRHMTPQGAQTRILADAGELMAVLRDVLGIDMPEARALWPKICARHEEIAAARAKEKPGAA